jgi:NAD(P)-dependent dehydrogenase (short-subunit alcohol dehydrogenase family)
MFWKRYETEKKGPFTKKSDCVPGPLRDGFPLQSFQTVSLSSSKHLAHPSQGDGPALTHRRKLAKAMNRTAPALDDPRRVYPTPPFQSQQKIPPPGHTAEMKPRPDHGENSYEGNNLLKDYATIITGADSGIGRAVALAFAREGADVVISYLDSKDDAAETERLVSDAGRKAVIMQGDIRDEELCDGLIDRCIGEFGKLDVLVNNAAYQSSRPSTEEISTEEFDRAFKTNVYSTFFLSRAALVHMKPGGTIINTSSIQGFDPSGHLLRYAATKGAIANMTRALAESAMSKGVRVNGVAPGPVWTPFIPSTMPEEKVKHFGKQTLFGRPAQPAEIAPVYVFLASKLASYVSGEIYGVTGGTMPL